MTSKPATLSDTAQKVPAAAHDLQRGRSHPAPAGFLERAEAEPEALGYPEPEWDEADLIAAEDPAVAGQDTPTIADMPGGGYQPVASLEAAQDASEASTAGAGSGTAQDTEQPAVAAADRGPGCPHEPALRG